MTMNVAGGFGGELIFTTWASATRRRASRFTAVWTAWVNSLLPMR